MIDLKESRDKIDEIDGQIVRLFEERMKVAGDVAEYKLETKKPVLDRERELQKLAVLESMAHTDFNRDAIRELYEQIMSMSRKYQYGLINTKYPERAFTNYRRCEDFGLDKAGSVCYFGVPGTYTQQAMFKIFGEDVTGHHERTFHGVMKAVQDGRTEFGVLPIENSSTGGVSANYDSILEYDNAIVGQYVLPIRQCLIGLKGANISDIRTIYSHPQGLMQCRHFLESDKDVQTIEYESTAAAAKKVADDGDISQAAIAGAQAASAYGLEVIAEDIQDIKDNSTRFIVIGPENIYTGDSDKISLCFELPHTSGSLYRILSHFLFNGLNLTLIESRPIPGRKWEYRFFVDVEGNLDSPAVKNALRGIHEEASFFRILGNYKAI
ncbi:MAG: prephenate dehydratase [Eubacterium sp.]|nr:prephenate dehydratase [Eubacterium sp.]